ncbi:MAG: hypothetical protein HW395_269 [candidate division NC10 bacterium]|nr:hypothetical protein [candidate division NC10 bacterium]
MDNARAKIEQLIQKFEREKAAGPEREQLRRQIEKTDREIDGLVYRLYNVNEIEQVIIEQASRASK